MSDFQQSPGVIVGVSVDFSLPAASATVFCMDMRFLYRLVYEIISDVFFLDTFQMIGRYGLDQSFSNVIIQAGVQIGGTYRPIGM